MHTPNALYVCPICNARVTAKRGTMVWCQCLPSTPTVMTDETITRSIKQAIGRTPLPTTHKRA